MITTQKFLRDGGIRWGGVQPNPRVSQPGERLPEIYPSRQILCEGETSPTSDDDFSPSYANVCLYHVPTIHTSYVCMCVLYNVLTTYSAHASPTICSAKFDNHWVHHVAH